MKKNNPKSIYFRKKTLYLQTFKLAWSIFMRFLRYLAGFFTKKNREATLNNCNNIFILS